MIAQDMQDVQPGEMPKAVEAANHLQQEQSIDAKTGLLKQQAWLEGLHKATEGLQDGDELTVWVADLNGFKAVNDDSGHDAGDELLKIVGEVFQEAFKRQSDVVAHGSREEQGTDNKTIARLGGDEFAVYAIKKNASSTSEQRITESTEETGSQAERVNTLLRKRLEGTAFAKYNVSLSIGGAELQEGDTPESVFAQADLKMFERKYQGKIDNITPEDREQLQRIIPFLEKIGHRVEPWAKTALVKAA